MNNNTNNNLGVTSRETPVLSRPKVLRHTKFTSITAETQTIIPEKKDPMAFDGYDMVAVFQTNKTGVTRLYNNRNEGVVEITIDGNPIELVTGYTFTDNEEHIVRYKFTDPKYVQPFTFSACTEMRSFKLADGMVSILMYGFEGCRGLTNVVLPDSMIGVAQYAFHYCKGLETVTFGPNTTIIGDYAFDQDTALKSITCKAVKAPKLEYNVFNYVGQKGILYYPAGSDYSSWLSKGVGYLGGHGWTGEEIQ
jgi:hypothetical protein